MELWDYIKRDIQLEQDDAQRFSRQHIDRTFWALLGCLVAAALVALYSASSTKLYGFQGTVNPVMKQMIIVVIGCGLAYGMQFMPTWSYRIVGYVVLALSLLALYFILFVSLLKIAPLQRFIVVANGAARWVQIAGITIQPSEFAKVGLVIVIADQLQRMHVMGDEKKYFKRMLILTIATCFPILVGNLSSVILIGLVIFLMWLLAGVNWKWLGGIVLAGLCFLIMGYFIVEFGFVKRGKTLPRVFERASVWVGRIDTMMAGKSDAADPYEINDKNYQASMAKIAVARSHLTGVMPGNSKMRDYLPLAYMDYIFAIIVEETGLFGTVFLIFVYLAILFRACLTSNQFEDRFAMLMVVGLALMLCCQALISMMVAVGIGPVTGQPLPLITQGGTSALATCIYFGIMMGVSREQASFRARQQNIKERSINDQDDIVIHEDKEQKPAGVDAISEPEELIEEIDLDL